MANAKHYKKKPPRIDVFDFAPGRILARRYQVVEFLGGGWEGEVYKATELRTGITRAVKVFFPHRNERDRAVRFYATKLDRLRNCPIVIQYHNSETIHYRGVEVTCLISELVEGELLSEFVHRQPGHRLRPFEALHVLYALASGLERVHAAREYHGDIHDGNMLVRRRGVHFDVKLVDFYHWGAPTAAKIREDIIQLVRVLYDAVGGRKLYAQQPPEIRAICLGLRRDRISKRFPTARHLREYLENFTWDE